MIWCSRRSLNRKYRESRADREKSARFFFKKCFTIIPAWCYNCTVSAFRGAESVLFSGREFFGRSISGHVTGAFDICGKTRQVRRSG